MQLAKSIQKLIRALEALPGVGKRTASRLAIGLLTKERDTALNLASTIQASLSSVKSCSVCNMLSDDPICSICSDPSREATKICLVESPLHMLAIEQGGIYRGRYFVLKGVLSPLDGIGPEEAWLVQLLELLREKSLNSPIELIVATNTTSEGQATAYWIADAVETLQNITVSRIAHGVPIGGDLDYIDGVTLSHALDRRERL